MKHIVLFISRRIFAVYGGVFIVMSYAWGYVADGLVLDLGDWIGNSQLILITQYNVVRS